MLLQAWRGRVSGHVEVLCKFLIPHEFFTMRSFSEWFIAPIFGKLKHRIGIATPREKNMRIGPRILGSHRFLWSMFETKNMRRCVGETKKLRGRRGVYIPSRSTSVHLLVSISRLTDCFKRQTGRTWSAEIEVWIGAKKPTMKSSCDTFQNSHAQGEISCQEPQGHPAYEELFLEQGGNRGHSHMCHCIWVSRHW